MSITLSANGSYSGANCVFLDNAYAVRVGHWALNSSSDRFEYVLDGTFSGTPSDAWKQRVEDTLSYKEARDNFYHTLDGFSLTLGALSLVTGPVGIPLSVVSTGISLYTYLANTDDFIERLEDILHDYSNTKKGIILELNPTKNYNTDRYWDYSNWPTMVHLWTYAKISVSNWYGHSYENYELKFSTVFSAKRTYYNLPMNVEAKFTLPIVLKNTDGTHVSSDSDLNVPDKEIFPTPTDLYVEGSQNSKIYERTPHNVVITIPNDYTAYNRDDTHTRLWVSFGDGHTMDISTDTNVREKNTQSTVFEIPHTWYLPSGLDSKTYSIDAFYYLDYPTPLEIQYDAVSNYPGSHGWVMKWYTNVWVSGIIEREITVLKNSSGGGGGSGGCPFLYTDNGWGWTPENNVLVWSENATRKNLETWDAYLFSANQVDGKIKVGIGEPGYDVDFIDSVNLYRVSAPEGYRVVEGYDGKVYAYRNMEAAWKATDSAGRNVTGLVDSADNSYWVGEKGDYIDAYINLSAKNLLVLRGIDNPPVMNSISPYLVKPPFVTMSTIWIYGNLSGEWVKLSEVKVRHNLHTEAIDLNKLLHRHSGTVELRFEMRDRNGIDFIGVAHEFRHAILRKVKMVSASIGYSELRHKDHRYLRLNPGDFVSMIFKGKGNGAYLLRIRGFYFNQNKIGVGIGLVKASETNIAEAALQTNISSGTEYVLLPLLENYTGVKHIAWFVDGHLVRGEKPVVVFAPGEHTVELLVWRKGATTETYTLQISVS